MQIIQIYLSSLFIDISIKQEQSHSQNQSSILENVGSAIDGLFDIPSSGSGDDLEEAEFQKRHKLKKKKQKRIGF